MTDDDDEIAERIAKQIEAKYWFRDADSHSASIFLDDCLAYHLAHFDGVRERAKVRRQDKRVRPKVFALLGLADRK